MCNGAPRKSTDSRALLLLKQNEYFADDLSDNKCSKGKSANNAISSPEWVPNSAECGAYLT